MSLIDDGNQEQPTGGQEQPTSTPSGGQGQQLSPDVSVLMNEVKELKKELRGIQKGTDKRFERQDDNIKRILELKEQGLSEPQIKRELYIDSLMQGQSASPAEPVGNENSRQTPDVESAFRTVEEYGLSQNDPDFIALLRGVSKMDKATFDAKVKDFVLGKVKPPKPASPADVVQAPVRTGATDKSKDALKSDYVKDMQAARGSKATVRQVQAKYRELGLDIENIGFGV
jgi:hypothetical protein